MTLEFTFFFQTQMYVCVRLGWVLDLLQRSNSLSSDDLRDVLMSVSCNYDCVLPCCILCDVIMSSWAQSCRLDSKLASLYVGYLTAPSISAPRCRSD